MTTIDLNHEKAATKGGCGCGCGGHGESVATATATAVPATDCGCGPDCTCGCQEGKPCTCGGTTATFAVTGMTCGHCVKAISEEVSGIPGVTGVDIDLETGAMTVTSDAPVDFDRIVEAVAEAGDEYAVS